MISKPFKLIILTSSLLVTGCGASLFNNGPTLRQVILEDVYNYDKNYKEWGIEKSSLTIDKSYIYVNGAVCFDVKEKIGWWTGAGHALEIEDVTIYFPSDQYVPYVWINHRFITLEKAYKDKIYSIDDLKNFKERFENKHYDFSFLDKKYVEPEENN